MVAVSKDARLEHARGVMRRAGAAGAPIRETNPATHADALRAAVVRELIAMDEAEWVVEGQRARLKEPPYDDIDWYALSNGMGTVMPDGTLIQPAEGEDDGT